MNFGKNRKINLLVIPDQFPENEKDISGIFIVNYLKCVDPYCSVTVFHNKLIGRKAGFTSRWFLNRFWVSRNVVTSKSISKVLKPLIYILWLFQGYKLSRKFKEIHIIHAHGTILGGTLAWVLSRKLNIPFVLTEHVGPFSKISNNIFRRYWAGVIMKKAQKVFTVSDHLKNEILDAGIEPNEIVVTHNPVDTDFFRFKRSINCNKVGFASRLVGFKGGLRVLMAFHILEDEFPNWKLVIGGDGPDGKLIKEYIEKNNLQERVEFKGYLTRAGLNNMLESIDFFVFPSKHESFGLVAAEAMAKGIPVIAPNVTGPSEFVDKNSGILVNPENIWEISQAIRKLIHGYQFYDNLGIRRRVLDEFGSKSFGIKLLNEYYNVLNIKLVLKTKEKTCVELQD